MPDWHEHTFKYFTRVYLNLAVKSVHFAYWIIEKWLCVVANAATWAHDCHQIGISCLQTINENHKLPEFGDMSLSLFPIGQGLIMLTGDRP